jgi:predicted DNA-binding transcriptional regulator AlpA
MNVDRIVRDPETTYITGLGRSQRARLEKKGLFPARRKLSADGRVLQIDGATPLLRLYAIC